VTTLAVVVTTLAVVVTTPAVVVTTPAVVVTVPEVVVGIVVTAIGLDVVATVVAHGPRLARVSWALWHRFFAKSQLKQQCVSITLTSAMLHYMHRRLSPVTLLRYAALCTVGQLTRKVS